MNESAPKTPAEASELRPVKGIIPDTKSDSVRAQTTFRDGHIINIDPMLKDKNNAPGDGQGDLQPGENCTTLYPGDAEAMENYDRSPIIQIRPVAQNPSKLKQPGEDCTSLYPGDAEAIQFIKDRQAGRIKTPRRPFFREAVSAE